MSKLSFEALQQRADEVVSQELLNSISGGTENACHDDPPPPPPPADDGCQQCQQDVVTSQGTHTPLGTWLVHQIYH
ncbi:hypothetical protein H2O64_02595 [Kordia sp. YSTF-M3]|uniref:Uncharacterized protein n=1 Tax=Kordia aestuariivivens TaxID=2759037 RepID=A0ABR7Q4V7_9FLAO|nr:hypothetical protein [Kordia aestuariivivens]MBC8753543.1 hypothetical protein [Kordia aestuariivivens]